MKRDSLRRWTAAALLAATMLAGAQTAAPPPALTPPPAPLPGEAVPELTPALEEPLPPPRREDATWTATLERIAQGVVAIKMDSTRAFDTEWNTSSQATGFVIDAEDRKSTRLNSSHVKISYAVFCLKKKNK